MKYILKQKGIKNEDILAKNALFVGMKLYGYCGGLFGRDSYGEKEIVEIHENYLVVKYDNHMYTTSFAIDGKIHTWAGLIEDSNSALEEMEQEDEEP